MHIVPSCGSLTQRLGVLLLPMFALTPWEWCGRQVSAMICFLLSATWGGIMGTDMQRECEVSLSSLSFPLLPSLGHQGSSALVKSLRSGARLLRGARSAPA